MDEQIHVLIVEDCEDTGISTAMLLGVWGARTTLAPDGRAGLRLALSEDPDVILLDLGLPDISGLDFARQLRLSRQFDRTMIVALTGYASAEDQAKSFRAGCQYHLAKPVDLDELRSILRDGLKEFRANDPSPSRTNREELSSRR